MLKWEASHFPKTPSYHSSHFAYEVERRIKEGAERNHSSIKRMGMQMFQKTDARREMERRNDVFSGYVVDVFSHKWLGVKVNGLLTFVQQFVGTIWTVWFPITKPALGHTGQLVTTQKLSNIT